MPFANKLDSGMLTAALEPGAGSGVKCAIAEARKQQRALCRKQ